jgi:hypothetical protein
MHKIKTVFLAVVLSLALASPSYALFGGDQECVDNSCNEYDYKDNSKTTIKDNNVLQGKGNTGIQGNKNHHNVVVGGDVNLGTNAGGEIVNKNKNENTNTNTNENTNENKNTNLNTNINSNKNTNTNTNTQGQEQGQSQGQDQSQGQGQAQFSKQANKQETNIKFEADKREHISGHAAPKTDAQLEDTRASAIRVRGGLLEEVAFLTIDQAKMAAKNASDMKVEPAVLFENDFSLDTIKIGEGETFGGFIYVFSDGSDSYLAAMDAEAAKVAMELGMTHIVRLGDADASKVLEGSSWNIGISGGASVISQGEDLAIAPSGGLGYGAAKSKSEYRPDAVYKVSYSKSLIRLK